MATVPITDDKTTKAVLKALQDKNDEASKKKRTVLETHGYTLGKTIGAGSYATVKVCYVINSLAEDDKYKSKPQVKIYYRNV